MFDFYSEVKEDGERPFAEWRKIVVERKTPRKVLVQANTQVQSEQQIVLFLCVIFPTMLFLSLHCHFYGLFFQSSALILHFVYLTCYSASVSNHNQLITKASFPSCSIC